MEAFPGARRFAFTIFDDTDSSTVENIRPVYQLLKELGFRTTKSVWVLPSQDAPFGGSCLLDPGYREFILDLKKDGFEIALHNVRAFDADRETVERGLDTFLSIVGENPRCHANHLFNRDNLYWGPDRLHGGPIRLVYSLATRNRYHNSFEGHIEDSRYFWGDLCRERVSYVRNLVFRDMNLARVNPSMPYHDPSRPFVNYWYSSCDGARGEAFCDLLREENQDRLEAEGGVCIMYTHFAHGFVESGRLNARFETLMRRLSRKNGWFVPVSSLLDYLRSKQTNSIISPTELASMERRWMRQRIAGGAS